MAQYETLSIRDEGPFHIVTLNRPDRMNALSRQLLLDLEAEFVRIPSLPDARVVIVTGAGDKAFCAGADLKERAGMSLDQVREVLGMYRSAFGAMDRCPKPVVAALNGVAFGGGFEVALACDLRVAVPSAKVGLPETSLAIIPGAGGTQRLPRLIGPGRAKELILLGTRLTATEALAQGLITAVAGDGEDAVTAAKRLTESLAHGAPIALAAALEAVDGAMETDFESGLDLERACYERTLVSRDRVEALAAFNEKRKPVYTGT